ncbi:MAG: Rrf2 family transcriptional regulator [Candidatus Omnitrophica bacterium]|nr:Rrf2 family transcriptional regulator [Candidatus Omnitrophota bacterium]
MKITYKGDYALKAVLDLALNFGKLVTIHDLAKHTDIPVKFLEQVLLDLKKGGFVESKRGKIGGYLLAKHPSKIKLGEVVRFIDGPIEPIGCVGVKYSGCTDTYNCVFRRIWGQVAQATSAIIDTITFEDLASQATLSKQELIYNI